MAQCRCSWIMDVLASCVTFFIYSVRDSWFNNILFFYDTHTLACSQSYHAKILVTAGNSCNLLRSFTSHGEHIKSQVHTLHYLPASFRMCFWDLTGICEKQKPICLGNYYHFYSQLHQYSCAGCSVWFVQEIEVPGTTVFFWQYPMLLWVSTWG